MKKQMLNVIVVISLGVIFSSCSAISNISQVKKNPTSYTNEEICIATIGTLFNKKLNIISVFDESNNGKILYLKYNRPSDGKLWRTACKVLPNNQVTWASIRNDGSIGRWRREETITYLITDNTITISNYYGTELAKKESHSLNDY